MNKSEKIVAFHGGLNDNSDPKDIEADECAIAVDTSFNRIGRVGVIGGTGAKVLDGDAAPANSLQTLTNGYGIFYYSTDVDKDGELNSEDWIVVYDKESGEVRFFYRDKKVALTSGGSPSPGFMTSKDSAFAPATDKETAQPNFYLSDGVLRYSDGNFPDTTSRNRVFSFLQRYWFTKASSNTTTTMDVKVVAAGQSYVEDNATENAGFASLVPGSIVTHETAGVIAPSTTLLYVITGSSGNPDRAYLSNNIETATIDVTDVTFTLNNIITHRGYYAQNQELKSVDDLGRYLSMFDASAANPATVNLSDGKITLAYWTSKGGRWSGSFQFACTLIYDEVGEGPMSEFSDTLNFKDNKVSFQVYIGTDDSFNYPLSDKRITGLIIYFRSHGRDRWTKLQEIDFLKGGKHRWNSYDGATQADFGVFGGSLTFTIANTSGSDKEAYKSTTSSITITNTVGAAGDANNNFKGFGDRYGFLRMWGCHNEPVYLNIDSSGDPISLMTGTHSMPITLPSEGTRKFQVELLDESFGIVKQSDESEITIASSNLTPPSDNTDDDATSS